MDLGIVGGYYTAYILARFFGLFFIVIGLMVLVRKNQMAYFGQFVESKEYLFIAGLMTLVLGAVIVALITHGRLIGDCKLRSSAGLRF